MGVPDILYHATTTHRMNGTAEAGKLALSGDRKVYLSVEEHQAWEVAHRLKGHPEVLVVDASRARRGGCQFQKTRNGMWMASWVDTKHILNLREGYAEQISAGGFPIWWDEQGPRLALIRVKRRNRRTWEVAKGKLEVGETPQATAVREVQEEMGVDVPMDVIHSLGMVRYGFQTPQGHPRLKSLHLYLLYPEHPPEAFQPSEREGISDVRWFTPEEAARAVTHRSLKPVMIAMKDLLAKSERGDFMGEE